MVPFHCRTNLSKPVPLARRVAERSVPLRSAFLLSSTVMLRPSLRACSIIFSWIRATTRQHSIGPRPDVICMIIFSMCLLFIHSYNFWQKSALGFDEVLLCIHDVFDVFVGQRVLFHAATDQGHSGIGQHLFQP